MLENGLKKTQNNIKKLLTYCLCIQFLLSFSQEKTPIENLKQKIQKVTTVKQKLEIIHAYFEKDAIELDNNSIAFLKSYIDLAIEFENWCSALPLVNTVANYYIFNTLKHEEAYNLCHYFEAFTTNCENKKQVANFYINYGEAATYLEKYQTAINIFEDCIQQIKNSPDTTLHAFGYAHLKIAENSTKIHKISESIINFKKAEDIFSKQKDTLFYLWTLNGETTLFSQNGLLEEADLNREKIFKLAPNPKYNSIFAIANLRASIDAFEKKDSIAEINYINRALKNLNSKSDVSEIISLLVYSFAVKANSKYGNLKKADSLLAILKPKILALQNDAFLNTYYSFALIQNHIAHGNLQKAKQIAYKLKNNIKKAKEATQLMEIEFTLSKILEQQNQNKKALSHYKNYLNIKDSLYNANTKNQFAYIKTKFDFEKKELELSEKQKSIDLLKSKDQLEKSWFSFISISLAGIFITLSVLRTYYFSRKKIKLQKQYARNIIKHAEAERKIIASELHDSVGQNLLLAKNKMLANPATANQTEFIDQAIEQVRSMSQSLHPFQFEKLGLIQSIKNTIETFQNHSQIFYSSYIKINHCNIPNEKKIFIFRMFQECINNVEKHSKATACNIKVEQLSNEYLFQIKDNGIGFHVKQKENVTTALGLKSLKEKAKIIDASLHIKSIINRGTTIQIIIPVS